ncbi:hypothetical protein I316_00920 [Kwoniella heveanensis BCC8398]|uniref:Uncharacterized protein n=1 Tax=Kwoniella heveanensis BCC8398 TaxID=1296120 RepID=A0A1B9H157_9TREE|nr:hypothetical protein I316_00920 [Kwoniella heveanensis BCC8398]
MSLPYTYTPFSPYPNYAYPLSEAMNTPSPIYTLLIMGMVFFMAANVMPNLIPAADRVWHVAPMVLQWGFIIIIFALMVQMTGLIPGVPQIHITYVLMAITTLLFILMWNHIVSQTPPAEEKKPSSSSSGKKEEKPEKKKEEKEDEQDKPAEPSPWDDLRAHPSAFLTTRLNKLMPWPFPMGKAGRAGGELWWEKGMPSHVGHFNRPDPDAAKKAAEAEKEASKKKKAKEEAEKKTKEKEKAEKEKAAKLKEKEKAEAEAKARAKAKEEEARRVKEEAKRRDEGERLKAIEDRHKLKMWRTKYLAMIIGISMLNKTLGFLLLLFFSLQLVSQELNEQPAASASTTSSSAPSASSSSSSSKPPSSTSSSSGSSSSPGPEKEKAAKVAAAAKEKEKAKASSSSSSSSKETSKEKEKESKVIGSEAVKKAAGSKTVTNGDLDEGFGVPYKVGFGMHYIHTTNPDKPGDLALPSLFIPSEGMSHPLMTTTYRQFAN